MVKATAQELIIGSDKFSVVWVGDLDPDYRRNPKTQHFCCLCQKDIKSAPSDTGYARYVDNGNAILSVQDISRFSSLQDFGEMHSFPIGPECAKKLPRGFVQKI